MPWIPRLRTGKKQPGHRPTGDRRADQDLEPPSLEVATERWILSLKSASHVLAYLSQGNHQNWSSQFSELENQTRLYLNRWFPNLPKHSAGCDKILEDLILGARGNGEECHEMPILACLSALTNSVAFQYLLLLQDVEVCRYLRCLTIVGQSRAELVSLTENEVTKSLLAIMSGSQDAF